MIKHFITKYSFGVLFLFSVIKPFITVYHRYAIFLRPISPPPNENQGCIPYELLPHNSCNLNYCHHICHIIVVYGTFMDVLQSKTNHRNSDFSFIEKAGDLHRVAPLSEVYSKLCCNTQSLNTI